MIFIKLLLLKLNIVIMIVDILSIKELFISRRMMNEKITFERIGNHNNYLNDIKNDV